MTTSSRGKDSSITLFMATLLLVAIEAVFFIPSILNAGIAFQNPSQSRLLLPSDLASLLLWIIIPMIYCSIVSIMIRPKRMVNPIHVQIILISIVVLLSIGNIVTTGGSVAAELVSITGFSMIAAFSVFTAIIMGVLEWLVVNWVIRMNYEGCNRVSFVVNMNTKDILHKLGRSFLDTWTFRGRRDIGDMWLLERNDNDRCLLIEVGPHPKDGTKSILATVAYEIQHDWIVESKEASDLREIILDNTEKKLGIEFSDNQSDLDDVVSRLALTNVKDKAQSRIEVTWRLLRKLHRVYQISLVLTTILLFALSIAYFYLNQSVTISPDTYIALTITLIIALFVEIGIPLREEISGKTREELDF